MPRNLSASGFNFGFQSGRPSVLPRPFPVERSHGSFRYSTVRSTTTAVLNEQHVFINEQQKVIEKLVTQVTKMDTIIQSQRAEINSLQKKQFLPPTLSEAATSTNTLDIFQPQVITHLDPSDKSSLTIRGFDFNIPTIDSPKLVNYNPRFHDIHSPPIDWDHYPTPSLPSTRSSSDGSYTTITDDHDRDYVSPLPFTKSSNYQNSNHPICLPISENENCLPLSGDESSDSSCTPTPLQLPPDLQTLNRIHERATSCGLPSPPKRPGYRDVLQAAASIRLRTHSSGSPYRGPYTPPNSAVNPNKPILPRLRTQECGSGIYEPPPKSPLRGLKSAGSGGGSGSNIGSPWTPRPSMPVSPSSGGWIQGADGQYFRTAPVSPVREERIGWEMKPGARSYGEGLLI